LFYTYIETPVGALLAARDDEGIASISFQKNGRPADPHPQWKRSDAAFGDLSEQLRAYFEGKLRSFDLPLHPEGTPFQRDVWRALQSIPYGQTRSYADIAREIARPKAVRAVGAANGANPLPIVVPCHRVIGSNGSLTGFGGGIAVKQQLLALESGARTLWR
jgi:methylated-DNA-[protein]-cysteine S-methyltransferase